MDRTKTIQFADRKLLTPLIPINGSVLCPVKAYNQMCTNVKVNPEAPLFSLSKNKFVTYDMFQKKLKDAIRVVGLDPDLYSSLSFRRGEATFAFRSGMPSELIQLHGDWKSDAYKEYLIFTRQNIDCKTKTTFNHK